MKLVQEDAVVPGVAFVGSEQHNNPPPVIMQPGRVIARKFLLATTVLSGIAFAGVAQAFTVTVNPGMTVLIPNDPGNGIFFDLSGGEDGTAKVTGLGVSSLVSPGDTVTTKTAHTGTLTMAPGGLGMQTIAGQVGTAANPLSIINAGTLMNAAATFSSLVFADTLNVGPGYVYLNGVGNNTPAVIFNPGGTLFLGNGANLTNSLSGPGGLILSLGSNTIAGPVTGLSLIGDGGGSSTFSSVVSANLLNVVGGTVHLNGVGDNKLPIAFENGGTVVLADGVNLTGATITTGNNKTGTLTLLGSSTITTPIVGQAALALRAINSGATGTDIFLGDVVSQALNLTGTGTTIFDGTAVISNLTAINSGNLIIGDPAHGNAAYTGNINVNNGGTLSGYGIIKGDVTNTGGTVLPGGAIGLIGTLTVTGNYNQTGGILAVELKPSQSSILKVSGTAAITGKVQAFFDPGRYLVHTYTILTAAGGRTGTYGTLATTNLPALFQASLSYDANDVFLNLSINPLAAPLAGGATPTGGQQATIDSMTQFMGVLTDPFIDGRCDAPIVADISPSFAGHDTLSRLRQPCPARGVRDAYGKIGKAPPLAPVVTFDPSWSVWAAGFGGSQTTNGNAGLGSGAMTSRLGAFAVGADYLISPSTIAGFALAGGGTNFSIVKDGNGHSDLFQAGGFIRHTVDQAYIVAALAYGWQDVTTDRTSTIFGIDQLHANFNVNAFSGRVEGGYRFITPWMGITPYAAGQFVTFSLPAYAESIVSGTGNLALAYDAKNVTVPRSEIGLRTDTSWALADSLLILRSRLAWAHDYNTDRSISATFQSLPSPSFILNGAAQAHDKVLTTISPEVKWPNGFSLAAAFEGEFSNLTQSYAGKGIVRYTW